MAAAIHPPKNVGALASCTSDCRHAALLLRASASPLYIWWTRNLFQTGCSVLSVSLYNALAQWRFRGRRYGGLEFSYLSVGIRYSRNCHLALRQAASRELLALRHHFRWSARSRSVHDRRSAP